MRKVLLGLMALSMTTAMAGETAFLQQKQRVTLTNDHFQSVLIPEGTVKKGRANVQTRSETKEIDYSIAEEPYSAIYLTNFTKGDEVMMLMYLSPEMTTKYDGATIKSINFWTGTSTSNTNKIRTYNVVMTEDLGAAPFYEKEETVSTAAFQQYQSEVDGTYKLEAGKGIYVGCYVTLVTRVTNQVADYYVVVDAIPTSDTSSAYLGARKADTEEWAWMDPEELTTSFGSICLSVTIEGDNYPEDAANLIDIAAPVYAEPGVPFPVEAYVKNLGVNAINSLEFECKVGDDQPVTITANAEKLESLHTSNYITIDGLVSNEISPEVPVEVKLVKVNGVTNNGIIETSSDYTMSFPKDQGFKSYGLIEEGTGTWCGFCPRGIVMMEAAKENYGDVYNRIAIHSTGGGMGQERMAVPTGEAVATKFFTGFPSAMINRYEVFDPDKAALDYYYNAVFQYPTWVGFEDLKATMISEDQVQIESTSKFVFDQSNSKRFRIAYYLTEDGLGPYPQTNYYAGGRYDELDGWEKKGSTVMTEYEDVMRLLVGGVDGFADSFPTTIESGESYTHTTTATTTAVSGNEFFVTAFIIDNVTGEVLNSYQVKASKEFNAVAGIENDGNIVVEGAQGCIVVAGDFAKASIYSLSGQKVAEINDADNVALPSGIYVVNADGFVKKVVVK